MTQIYALIGPDNYVQGFEHVEDDDQPSTLGVTYALIGPEDTFVPPTCPEGRRLTFANGALTVVDPRTLDEVKATQIEVIKAARDAVVYGGFTWDGSTFNSDDVSQGRIGNAFNLATNATYSSATFPKIWKLADNTTRLLSASDMIAVGLALNSLIQPAFNTGAALEDQINSATTAAAVEAIVWPAS